MNGRREWRRKWVTGWVFFVLATSFFVPAAWAEDKKFAEINGRYLSLRNTDVAVQRVAEWRNVADKFAAYGRAHRGTSDGARSLLHGGLAYLTIFGRSKEPAMLAAGRAMLTDLGQRNDELSDDALLELARVAREVDNDQAAARAYETKILNNFPKSDSALVLTTQKSGGGAAPKNTITPALEGPLVVIDPGHGGEDFGAVGVGGLLEKDLTLTIALAIENLAKKAGRPRIVLTRRTDVFVPLRERMQKANELGAAMFVSLHANSTPKKDGHGIEVYYLELAANSEKADKAAREVAARENESVRFEGPEGDLAYMLGDLVQSGKMPESRALATKLLDELIARLSVSWPEVRRLAVRSAPFYVLVGSHMPCVLLEVGFIDHPIEGARLAERAYRGEIARAIYSVVAGTGTKS